MRLRRAALIAGGGLGVSVLAAGFAAESVGIDPLAMVDRLIALAMHKPDAPEPEQHEASFAQDDPAGANGAVKGDRLIGSDDDAALVPRLDPQAMRKLKAAHEAHETAGSEGAGEGGQELRQAAAAEHREPEKPADGHAGLKAGDNTQAAAAHGEPEHAGPKQGGEKHAATAENNGESHAASEEFDAELYSLPPGNDQPWSVFRRLQSAQDRIVLGVNGSLQAYRNEMARANEQMLALPASVWRHPRNVISAAAYVMAGGKPELARHVLAQIATNQEGRDLLAGALAFTQGEYYRAYNLLYHVNPRSLPISIGGQVSLVKAMLMSPRDIKAAASYLTQARQLAPGTLVEEAALRRLIRIEAEAGDADAFFQSANSYATRFPKSVFLSDFLRNFASGSLRFPDQNSERLKREVESIAGRIDTKARIFLFSLLARGATVFGHYELAREVSERSLELVRDDPRLVQRLNLYLAASMLTEAEQVGGARDRLNAIEVSALGLEDARLLEAAKLVAEGIEKPLNEESLAMPDLPMPEEIHSNAGGGVDRITVSSVEDKPMTPILERSRSMLALADQALEW